MNPWTGFNGDTGTCVDVTRVELKNIRVYNVDVNGMELNFTAVYKPIFEPAETTEAEPGPEQVMMSMPLQRQRLYTRN
jgi:hypothetical protein